MSEFIISASTITNSSDSTPDQSALVGTPIRRPENEKPIESQHAELVQKQFAWARAWKANGDQDARAQLIQSGLGLVRAIARTLSHRGISTEDLMSEGTVGLIRAVDGFDPECGVRFGTFAFRHIRHSMTRLFAAESPRGKLTSESRRLVSVWESAVASLTATSGETPDDSTVARELDWPIDRVGKARRLHAQVAKWSRKLAVDVSEAEQHESSLSSQRTSESDEGSVSPSKCRALLNKLTPRERQAVSLMYGIDVPERMNAKAAAAVMGCSSQELRRLQVSAHGRLKRFGARAPGAWQVMGRA